MVYIYIRIYIYKFKKTSGRWNRWRNLFFSSSNVLNDARCVGNADVNFWKSLCANGAGGMQVEKGHADVEFVSDSMANL